MYVQCDNIIYLCFSNIILLGVETFQATPQFQLIKVLKVVFLNLIEQIKKENKEREHHVFVNVAGNTPISVRITLVWGHWTPFGSVMIRLENFPLTYDNSRFDCDFSIMLLEPVSASSSLSTELVYFNAASVIIADPSSFENWLQIQITNAWNDP